MSALEEEGPATQPSAGSGRPPRSGGRPVVRIAHVDRDAVFVACLARLAPDSDIEAFVATDNAMAADMFRAGRIDVVLVEMADPHGVEALAQVRASAPGVPVLVLSAAGGEYRLAEALAAGAAGYLLKRDSSAAILAGIRDAAGGGTPVSPALSDALVSAIYRARGGRSTGLAALTARERQVVGLMHAGHTTRTIAEALGISKKTVECHRARIYAKTGIRSAIELCLTVQRSRFTPATSAEAAE